MPISCNPICITNLIYGYVEHENTICTQQRKGEENKSGANNKLIVCGFTLKEKGFSVMKEAFGFYWTIQATNCVLVCILSLRLS